GLESPTVSPLHHEGWVAVRAMVPTSDAQRIMDELYDLGARAILTTGIHAAPPGWEGGTRGCDGGTRGRAGRRGRGPAGHLPAGRHPDGAADHGGRPVRDA